jgi:hypothetical protein
VIVSPSVRSSRSAASAGSACVPAPHGPAVLSGWRQRHRGSASSRYPGARVRIRTVSLAPAEWTANCTRETRLCTALVGWAGRSRPTARRRADRPTRPPRRAPGARRTTADPRPPVQAGSRPRCRVPRSRAPASGLPRRQCAASPEFRGSPYPPTTRRSSTSAAPAMRLSGLRRSFHARGRRGVRLDQDRGVRVDDSDAVARLPREPS